MIFLIRKMIFVQLQRGMTRRFSFEDVDIQQITIAIPFEAPASLQL